MFQSSFFRPLVALVLPLAVAASARTAGAVVVGDYTFNDGSGTTANDSSPSNNDGTLQNFANTSAGAGDAGASGWTSGGGLRLDGTDDHVTTPVAVSDFANSFTAESIFTYAGPANRTWTPLFGSTQTPFSANEIFYVGKTQGNTNLTLNFGGLANYNFATPTLFDGQPHHLAVVFDGTGDTIQTYIDGALVNTRSGVTGTYGGTGDTLLIGASGHAAGERWIGTMDHVRVSTDVLGPGQFIPEPGSLGASALAAAALLLRRRARR